MNTKIEWADRVWNPITGCFPISSGCDNCYARRMANRLSGRFGYPLDDPFRVTFHPDRLDLPLYWGKPSRIFVNSMGDLFHKDVQYSDLDKVFGVMWACLYQAKKGGAFPWHTFQILTKRPELMFKYLSTKRKSQWATEAGFISINGDAIHDQTYYHEGPHPRIWLGVTVENADYKPRIDILRRIPAAVRFVSFEPLIGDVGKLNLNGIHWVIVGGETGPGARPMHANWPIEIYRQCIAQKVPFFFKKWGSFWGNGLSSAPMDNIRAFPKPARQ